MVVYLLLTCSWHDGWIMGLHRERKTNHFNLPRKYWELKRLLPSQGKILQPYYHWQDSELKKPTSPVSIWIFSTFDSCLLQMGFFPSLFKLSSVCLQGYSWGFTNLPLPRAYLPEPFPLVKHALLGFKGWFSQYQGQILVTSLTVLEPLARRVRWHTAPRGTCTSLHLSTRQNLLEADGVWSFF